MPATKPTTAILHYTAPPVVGGVEAVMDAHARVFLQMDYPVSIIAGQGSLDPLSHGCELDLIPELDSQHSDILAANEMLEKGQLPEEFAALVERLRNRLVARVSGIDNLIVHNVFTKHFNLPLTAAIFDLLDAGTIKNCIAWHHDFTWTSPRSRSKVHPGYPWNLLRTYRPDVIHVTISQQRHQELTALYGCPEHNIRIIYNGVDPAGIFGLTTQGWQLIRRLNLLTADLIMLMPVRVTRAKNIEYALEVIATLKAEGSKAKFVLTGPPDPHDDESMTYFRSLQRLRDDLGLHEEMHFVFESGSDAEKPYLISLDIVADLYRVADLLFMPSLQEGFGMPVMEAGLLGLPIVASETVPAAEEIGGEDVVRFSLDQPPEDLAKRLLTWATDDPRLRLARRVRQSFTWEAIFREEIEPLLHGKEAL